MPDADERRQFLTIAAVFEGVLALAAFGLGWFADVDPLETFRLTPEAISGGVVAAGPMIVLFWLSMRFPFGPLRAIRRFLMENFAPYLSSCRWYDLIALALLAGLGEELLFRGVLQPWLAGLGLGLAFALIASNVLFGLAHAITPTYAILAAGMGTYLGWLGTLGDEPNLVLPITTHAVYDWIAFWYVVRQFRQKGYDFEPTTTSDSSSPTHDE